MTTAVFEAPEDLADVERVDQADALDGDTDADAPYGRNPKTGEPYRRSPEWRAKMATALAAGRATQAQRAAHKAPQRQKAKTGTSGRPGAVKAVTVDYRPGVLGLLQLPALFFAMTARATGDDAWALDSATITLHGPQLAEAVHQTALQDERIAAILDRAMALGPYGALIGATMPILLQIACNHGKMAPNPEMGILSREQLLDALRPPG